MINTLGEKWLEYDGTDKDLLAKQGRSQPTTQAMALAVSGLKNGATNPDEDVEDQPKKPDGGLPTEEAFMHKTDTHRDQMTTEARDKANQGVGSEPKKVSRVNDVNPDFD